MESGEWVELGVLRQRILLGNMVVSDRLGLVWKRGGTSVLMLSLCFKTKGDGVSETDWYHFFPWNFQLFWKTGEPETTCVPLATWGRVSGHPDVPAPTKEAHYMTNIISVPKGRGIKKVINQTEHNKPVRWVISKNSLSFFLF